jgi:hypothetical protein
MPYIFEINEMDGSAIPPNKILYDMENQAYQGVPANVVDGWSLLQPYGKGIKAYRKNFDIVISVRGTADVRDVQADLQIIYSGLSQSSRFKEDESIVKKIQEKYPPRVFKYYGVGHSLGGAILDELIDRGYIREGISYNPAVDLLKFKDDTRNHRIYNESDILYNIMGRFTKNPEVRKNKLSTLGKIASYIPLGTLGNSINAHLLSNFVGGFYGLCLTDS